MTHHFFSISQRHINYSGIIHIAALGSANGDKPQAIDFNIVAGFASLSPTVIRKS